MFESCLRNYDDVMHTKHYVFFVYITLQEIVQCTRCSQIHPYPHLQSTTIHFSLNFTAPRRLFTKSLSKFALAC